jgi:tetratricopeptide (TPR) repeat protein
LTDAGGPSTLAATTAMKPPASPVSPPPSASRWPVALAVAVIIAAGLAAYQNSFSGPFVFDDTSGIVENRTIRQGWTTWRALVPPPNVTVSGRPVANFSLAVNYAISGRNVWSYHALNLLIHLLGGITLLGIVRRTLMAGFACGHGAPPLTPGGGVGRGGAAPRASPSRRGPPATAHGASPEPADAGGPWMHPLLRDHATLVSLTVALLWTVHPLQTEAVTYVVQRVESLMALFFLLTFYCFIRALDAPQPRRWQVGAVVACLLGVATKEVAVTIPILLLLYDRTFVAGTFRQALRLRLGVYLALVATWVPLAALVASTGWDRGGTSGFDVGITPVSYWLTQFEAVTRYVVLPFWPHPLVFEYGTFWVHRAAVVVPYAIVVVGLAAATLVALRRRSVPGFLGACFFAILAPTSVIPGRIQMIVEHRMYLPLAAVIALVVGAAALRWGRRGLCPFLALAAALVWLTVQRNETYRTALSLWSDTLVKRPLNERAFNCRGVVLFEAGRIQEAVADYETALRMRPQFPEAHNNLGYALTDLRRIPEAVNHLAVALQLKPKYPQAHNNLGNALLQVGRVAEAIQHYQAALQIEPDDAKTHYNLGNAHLQAGRIPAAIEQYQIALRIDPEYTQAHYNLGNVLLQAGQVPAATAEYRTALRLKPDYADARNNLGNALLQMEQVNEAIEEFQAALRLNPGSAEGHNNLGAALFHAGRTAEAIREFEAALMLKPDYQDARNNLERMRPSAPAGAGTPGH